MFTKFLLDWHLQKNTRKLPWKGIKNPYKIWLSEIILQQTRAEQGLPYYTKIIEKYPKITDLASASDNDMYRLWQGLGYYNRCKNMLFTARLIVEKHKGIFPDTYEEIFKLKGIGTYTAAAIASFAFKLPYAVVDGNVVRVLSRVFAIKKDFYTSEGKKYFIEKAQELLHKQKPDLHNQAIMDLGATICKPVNPLCDTCPLQKICLAYSTNKIAIYPVKKKQIKKIERHFHFFIPKNKGFLYVQQRSQKDIWQNLYIPFFVEHENAEPIEAYLPYSISNIEYIHTEKQILSHQKIIGKFYWVSEINKAIVKEKALLKISCKDILKYGFPRLIISFFEKKSYL